jgi:hypothetical protein
MRDVQEKKLDLVRSCQGAKSIRDFGGLWGVHGKYLLQPAITLEATFASEVDVTPTKEFDEACEATRSQAPDLDIEFVNADFRDPKLYNGLRPCDLSILFDVLLHQDNYVSVMQNVANVTTQKICVAQPCLSDTTFPLPASATLLQFWPEELRDEYREGSVWPKEPRTEIFATQYWMWGQTPSHIIDIMRGLGWRCDYDERDAYTNSVWQMAYLRFSKD